MAQADDLTAIDDEPMRVTWVNERVSLDGACFTDCTFRRCTMVYAGGLLPCFVGATRIEDCNLALEGAADCTFELLKLLCGSGGSQLVEQLLAQVRRDERG